MNVFELTIIYLALGAPFGVYYVTSHPADAVVQAVWNGSLNLFLWPLYVGMFIYDNLRHPPPGPATTQELRAEIEARVSGSLGAREMRTFIDALAVYIGLSEAAEMPVGTSAFDSLAEIGVVTEPKGAAAVARRRNRERILAHRKAARASLLAINPDETTAATLERLASVLNDHAFFDEQRHRGPRTLNSSPNIDQAQVSIAA